MLEMRVEDMRQLYEKSLVLYKNKPVYIQMISHLGDVQFMDLLSQRLRTVAFSMKDFTAPLRRLGFINTMGSVIYASRIPVRRYKVGLNDENVKYDMLPVNYPSNKGQTLERVKTLSVPEVGDSLFNKYPSLEECVEYLRRFKGAMAFDKQFAVTSEGLLYYKTNEVGRFPRGTKKTEDLTFAPGFEHLAILLNGNHEKTVPTSRIR